jgi:hypothetical protein
MHTSFLFGGEGGIRTPGAFYRTPVFKTGTINHSVTSPEMLTESFIIVSNIGRLFQGLAGNDSDKDL